MEGSVKVQSGLHKAVSLFNGQLLCHFPHLIPGLWIIRVCEPRGLPHVLVIVNRACHNAVVNIVNLAVDDMSAYTVKIRIQIV